MTTTPTDPTTPTAPTTSDVPLTAFDRCDRCQAQAYARWLLNGSDLLFCLHHQRQYADRLLFAGAVLDRDETSKLTAPTADQS